MTDDSWVLVAVEGQKEWTERMDREECEAILSTAGSGGFCRLSRGSGDVSLIKPGFAARSWIGFGPLAVDQTIAMAECRKAANPEDPAVFGTEGIRCEAQPSGYVFPQTPSKVYLNTEHGSRQECLEIAIEARYGRLCAQNLKSKDFPFGLFDIATNQIITKFKTNRECRNALQYSAPNGACVAITDDWVYLYARPENGHGSEKVWVARGQTSLNQVLNECQEFAMAGYEHRAKVANHKEPQSPEQLPQEADLDFAGVVSRNPTFRPGTAVAELAMRVNDEEIIVQIDNATSVDLGSGKDLSQLLGTSVVVTGKRQGGVLVATAIRAGE